MEVIQVNFERAVNILWNKLNSKFPKWIPRFGDDSEIISDFETIVLFDRKSQKSHMAKSTSSKSVDHFIETQTIFQKT